MTLPQHTNWQETARLPDGTRLGKSGARWHILDEEGEAISRGYHEIEKSSRGYRGKIGGNTECIKLRGDPDLFPSGESTEYATIEEALRAERPWLDEEVLRELYEEKRMSSIEIAQYFGNISDAGVRYWLDRHGIEIRGRSEAAEARWEKLRSPEHLRRLADEIEEAVEEP